MQAEHEKFCVFSVEGLILQDLQIHERLYKSVQQQDSCKTISTSCQSVTSPFTQIPWKKHSLLSSFVGSLALGSIQPKRRTTQNYGVTKMKACHYDSQERQFRNKKGTVVERYHCLYLKRIQLFKKFWKANQSITRRVLLAFS